MVECFLLRLSVAESLLSSLPLLVLAVPWQTAAWSQLQALLHSGTTEERCLPRACWMRTTQPTECENLTSALIPRNPILTSLASLPGHHLHCVLAWLPKPFITCFLRVAKLQRTDSQNTLNLQPYDDDTTPLARVHCALSELAFRRNTVPDTWNWNTRVPLVPCKASLFLDKVAGARHDIFSKRMISDIKNTPDFV